MNDSHEYEKAKNESEPLCFAALDCPNSRFKKPIKANAEQDRHMHTDVFAIDCIDNVIAAIDVKHVKVENIKTKKYSLSVELKKYVEEDSLKTHWLAFRLADDKKLLNEFLCVRTLDVLNHCSLEEHISKKTGKPYLLVNIDNVKQNCKDKCMLKLDY